MRSMRIEYGIHTMDSTDKSIVLSNSSLRLMPKRFC